MCSVAKTGRTTLTLCYLSEGVHCSCMGSAKTKNYTVMAHTQVNLSIRPRLEIMVPLLELGVGLVSRVSLVSSMVRERAMLCMLS